ncbi:MAG: hypothetical protein KDA96_23075 [Planctomycetaceae bacterium]|nr:hypothetical protein [Planctomycetaceae bacterium]
MAHAHGLPQIVVKIDRRIWNEIVVEFPVTGEHHRAATANAECRCIVVAFILSALRDDYRSFSFNQVVLDHMHMVGAKKRKKLIKYFARSRFSTVEANYSTGHHSIIRRLSGARFHRSPRYQHNIVAGEPDVASPLQSLPAQWEFAGDTVTIDLPISWFRSFGASYRDACSKLFQKQWQYVPCIESSTSRCLIGLPTFLECLHLIEREPRTAECPIPEAKARIWRDMWAEWQQDPLLYLFRAAGRCYYPLVNQPKLLRHRYLKFRHNGQIEDAAEVDMSATYWVLLACMLDQSACREVLVRDLVNGCFYERLNAESGNSLKDTRALKRAVQKDCLFGRRNFGRTRLFATMERLYPDLARLIRHRRSNYPVRWLSDRLTNAEGAFFIDCVLPFVVDAGIPALPIHDAIVVPASAAEQVKQLCCDLAQTRFGFVPRFKITKGAVA